MTFFYDLLQEIEINDTSIWGIQTKFTCKSSKRDSNLKGLTLKFLDYVLPKTPPKLPFLVQIPNFGKNPHFQTHLTIGSCSKLVSKDVEKISEISTMPRLEDISI